MKVHGHIIKKARTEGRISARGIARTAGVSTQTVDTLETTGEAGHVQGNVIAAIANAIGIPIRDLIKDEASPTATTPLTSAVGATILLHDGLHRDVIRELAGSVTKAETAISELRTALRTAGLTITDCDGVLRITPLATATFDQATVVNTLALQGKRQSITREDSRIVWEAIQGRSEKQLRANANGHQRTGRLINTGILVAPYRQTEPPTLSDDVRFSLMLD